MRTALLLAGLVLLAGCGGGDETAPRTSEVAWPADLTAYVDQTRIQRVGRDAFVRLVHEGDGEVTVTRAEVASDRLPRLEWTGEKTFTHEADLDLELPLGRCGTGSDARVRLTYRVDGGAERVSTTTATDRYGAVGLLLDRDCAQRTFEEAATLQVGEGRVVGEGRASEFVLPLRVTATGDRPDVTYAGLDGTVLFTLVDTGATYGAMTSVALAPGVVVEQQLAVVPSRCDPHALAEDKVGTLFPLHVDAPGLAAGSVFTLPLDDRTRADLRGFFGPHCGFGEG